MNRRLTSAFGALCVAALLCPHAALADAVSTPVTADSATADVAAAGPLSDVPANSWAYDAVNQLVRDGIIKGYPDGTFKGQRPMTRYEAAVMAYRAVDYIEAEITAGKAVDAKLRSDMDAANKMLAAFGTELKAVQQHVAALQSEADATKREADATQKTVGGQASQIGALQQFDRRAYIKFHDIFREFAYGGNVNANCGPGAYAPGAAGSIQSYCAATGGGNALLPGARTAGYGPSVGGTPPSQTIPNGQRNAGLGFNYMKISFTGTPTRNTAFLVELSNSTRMSDTSGSSNTTGYCEASQNYLNGNSAEASNLTNCNTTAKQAAYNNGEPGFLASMNNVWFQQSIPNSGLYLRLGHVQINEGPDGSSWLGGDYFWGGMFGITKGPLNAYLAYGVGNAANTNLTLDNIPEANQKLVAEADYTFDAGKTKINVGGLYMNYNGAPMTEWDPAAVICTGAGGQTKYYANTAAAPFTSCGAGLTPITYANGAPITGAYLSAASNNPTITGTSAASFKNFTPGLAVTQSLQWVGAHVTFDLGKLHLGLAGSYRLGDDPYTGTGFKGPLFGAYNVVYGPSRNKRGQWSYESRGLAAQFNSLTPLDNYFGGPSLDNSWNTNFSGLYWVSGTVRYWTSNYSSIALGYGHTGLLPNTVLPAGGVSCPGCVVTGYNQNAGYLEMDLSF